MQKGGDGSLGVARPLDLRCNCFKVMDNGRLESWNSKSPLFTSLCEANNHKSARCKVHQSASYCLSNTLLQNRSAAGKKHRVSERQRQAPSPLIERLGVCLCTPQPKEGELAFSLFIGPTFLELSCESS